MQRLSWLKWLCISIGILYSQTNVAQSYDVAAGIRLGSEIGLTVKSRIPPIDKNFTAEYIIQSDFDGREVLMSLLAAQHLPLITRRLNFYSGLGLHKGFLNTVQRQEASYDAPFGVSFIGGAEVNFKRLSIAIDYKPALNIKGGERVFNSSSAITFRYIAFQRHSIFTSPREKRKRQRQKKRRLKARNQKNKTDKGWQIWKKH